MFIKNIDESVRRYERLERKKIEKKVLKSKRCGQVVLDINFVKPDHSETMTTCSREKDPQTAVSIPSNDVEGKVLPIQQHQRNKSLERVPASNEGNFEEEGLRSTTQDPCVDDIEVCGLNQEPDPKQVLSEMLERWVSKAMVCDDTGKCRGTRELNVETLDVTVNENTTISVQNDKREEVDGKSNQETPISPSAEFDSIIDNIKDDDREQTASNSSTSSSVSTINQSEESHGVSQHSNYSESDSNVGRDIEATSRKTAKKIHGNGSFQSENKSTSSTRKTRRFIQRPTHTTGKHILRNIVNFGKNSKIKHDVPKGSDYTVKGKQQKSFSNNNNNNNDNRNRIRQKRGRQSFRPIMLRPSWSFK